MRFHRFTIAVLICTLTPPITAQGRVPTDLSTLRGFNYQSAETIGHAEFWLQYNPAVTERDLDYARRLQLNQVGAFVRYAAWERNKEVLRKNLLHFVRAARERGIEVMPTMQYKFGEWKDRAAWPDARDFVADLVATKERNRAWKSGMWRTSPSAASSRQLRTIDCAWNMPSIWPRFFTNSIP
jgi:hypothetical protein